MQPLVNDSQLDQFKDDLKAVYGEAMELGRKVERDRSPVYIDTASCVRTARARKNTGGV